LNAVGAVAPNSSFALPAVAPRARLRRKSRRRNSADGLLHRRIER